MWTDRNSSSVVEHGIAGPRVTGSIPVCSFFYFHPSFNNLSFIFFIQIFHHPFILSFNNLFHYVEYESYNNIWVYKLSKLFSLRNRNAFKQIHHKLNSINTSTYECQFTHLPYFLDRDICLFQQYIIYYFLHFLI